MPANLRHAINTPISQASAKKEGYEQIAALFLKTAENEKEHAKLWFKELGGIGTTAENLMAAAEGEHDEWTSMYKRMAEEAREEGFHRIADLFAAVGEIEKSHYERYLKLLENLENDEVFKKSSVKVWYCRNCGHLEYGDQGPRCMSRLQPPPVLLRGQGRQLLI